MGRGYPVSLDALKPCRGVHAWTRTPQGSQRETPRLPGVTGGQQEVAPGVAWLSGGSESLGGGRAATGTLHLLLFSDSA